MHRNCQDVRARFQTPRDLEVPKFLFSPRPQVHLTKGRQLMGNRGVTTNRKSRFFLSIEAADPQYGARKTKAFLEEIGAVEVHEVEP